MSTRWKAMPARRTSLALLGVAITVAMASVGVATGSRSGDATAQAAGATGSLVAAVYPQSADDWAVSNGDLGNGRFSTLNQINASNVGKLKVAWRQSLDTPTTLGPHGAFGGIQSTPIEQGGVMYVQTPNGVDALDATNGKVRWTFTGTAPLQQPCFAGGLFCIGSSANASRNIALGDGKVYVGEQDGSIVAVDQKNGKQIWQAQVAAIGTTSGTVRESNPWTIYADGVVLTSVNGGDSPLQGHVDAYNAKDGTLLWRWFTTPDPTALPFILTWTNPAEAATGGASPWVVPAVDTKLGRVYLETGNAHANLSPGKNLWSASLVSLDLKTGKLMWYFQGVHHDQWDYDCSTPPVIFNTTVNGKKVPAVAATCKPSYIFVFDRRNGRQIFPIKETPVPNPGNQPLGTQWPTQPETTGGSAQIIAHCPTAEQVAAAIPTPAPKGTTYLPTCPFAVTTPGSTEVWGASMNGGTDMMPMSLNPQTGDLYICANGALWNGTGGNPTSGVSGTISALNVATNKLEWQNVWQADVQGECYGGILSTAGGLVFAGSMGQPPRATTAQLVSKNFGGTLYAYDAKTGKTLFSYQNVSEITAPPITYQVGGRQYVAVDMASSVDYNSFLPSATGDLLTVFWLGKSAGKGSGGSTTTPGGGGSSGGAVKPPATETLVGDPASGSSIFTAQSCGSCHTLAAAGAKGTAGPSLDATAPSQAAIVQQVTNGGFNMPSYGGKLTTQQINDVASYVYKSTHA